MRMRVFRSLAAASVATWMVFARVSPRAGAASSDSDDSVSPAGTTVTSTSSNFTLSTVVDGLPTVTYSCSSSILAGKTPAKGLRIKIAPPKFTGCTDNYGGTDTVAANSTNGSWLLTFVDRTNDEAGEVPGDKLKLTVPRAGLTLVSSILPSCTVTVAPTAAAPVKAAYDDLNMATFTNATIPVQGSGCSTSPSAALTATYTLNPGINDVS